jgi:hypothetical protein
MAGKLDEISRLLPTATIADGTTFACPGCNKKHPSPLLVMAAGRTAVYSSTSVVQDDSDLPPGTGQFPALL